jgi:hypothetical protein
VRRARLAASTPPYEVAGNRYVASSISRYKAVLDEYFKGPGATERYSLGYSAIYDGFTGYTQVTVENGVASVFLKGACNPARYDYTIADLVTYNLKQFPEVQFVKIYDADGGTVSPGSSLDSRPACLIAPLTLTAGPSPTGPPPSSTTPTLTATPSVTPGGPTLTSTRQQTLTPRPTDTRWPTATRRP